MTNFIEILQRVIGWALALLKGEIVSCVPISATFIDTLLIIPNACWRRFANLTLTTWVLSFPNFLKLNLKPTQHSIQTKTSNQLTIQSKKPKSTTQPTSLPDSPNINHHSVILHTKRAPRLINYSKWTASMREFGYFLCNSWWWRSRGKWINMKWRLDQSFPLNVFRGAWKGEKMLSCINFHNFFVCG